MPTRACSECRRDERQSDDRRPERDERDLSHLPSWLTFFLDVEMPSWFLLRAIDARPGAARLSQKGAI